MRKAILICLFAVLTLTATASAGQAAETDLCAAARDAALNARNALSAYFAATGEYPEKLSGTQFSPPDDVVVIYENMKTDPAKEFYMVRAYAENCGTMYLTVPTSSEVFRIPLADGNAKTAAATPVSGQSPTRPGTTGIMPFIVSTAAFFLVFMLVMLIFYYRYKKSASAPEPEKAAQSPQAGDESQPPS